MNSESDRPVRLETRDSGTAASLVDRMNDELLEVAEVAAILKVRVKWVYELGIPALRVSRRTLRWRRSDLEEWLAARREAA